MSSLLCFIYLLSLESVHESEISRGTCKLVRTSRIIKKNKKKKLKLVFLTHVKPYPLAIISPICYRI